MRPLSPVGKRGDEKKELRTPKNQSGTGLSPVIRPQADAHGNSIRIEPAFRFQRSATSGSPDQ